MRSFLHVSVFSWIILLYHPGISGSAKHRTRPYLAHSALFNELVWRTFGIFIPSTGLELSSLNSLEWLECITVSFEEKLPLYVCHPCGYIGYYSPISICFDLDNCNGRVLAMWCHMMLKMSEHKNVLEFWFHYLFWQFRSFQLIVWPRVEQYLIKQNWGMIFATDSVESQIGFLPW